MVSVLEIPECPNLVAVFSCLTLPATTTAAVLARLANLSICSLARPVTIHHNYDDAPFKMLRSRRDNMWGPRALAQSALMTLVAEGLDFAIKMACGRMIQTWPQEYIEEGPLPYFP
ncbi:hypothetical protein B0H14DRAFT_3776955 [Mycena olivaceomarginata]|nr:hypothetical protein B0H14DRAFT_3776955 [Mycena olivaceomarginata]